MAGLNNSIKIISTAADGTQGDVDSGAYNGGGFYQGTDSFSVSADGTKIAFISDATNLVPGDNNGLTDVFVKNLTTGAITLASTVTGADAGRSLHPTLSSDGTKVAFETTPFVNGSPFGATQIFLKDLTTGAVTLVSTSSSGTRNGLSSSSPTFSPDGTKLAYFSSADLTTTSTNRVGGIYLRDLRTDAVTLVSSSAAGASGNGYSSEPTFSPDGTKIAFTSASTNLGATTRTGLISDTDVYVKDLTTGAVTLVSAGASGERGTVIYNQPAESSNAAFSPDGKEVAFQSNADNLVPGGQGGGDVFIKDLASGAITRVTSLADGSRGGGYGPAFSPDGTKIAFWTATAGYTPGFYYVGDSIYIKNLVTGAFTLASTPADPAVLGIGDSFDPQFSLDGSELVFWSTNNSLVIPDANGNKADIFVKTLSAKPVVAPPVAVADSYTTAQGTPLSVAVASGLLANDTDADGKPLTALLVGNPAHGALTFNSDGSFTYKPAAGYSGPDTFTYKAFDGTVQSATATVSLTITAVDHPVAATDDSYTVSNMFPSAAFTTSAGTGVLVNDTAPDGGLTVLGIVVGGTVQAGFVPTAAGGQANISPDGRLTYDQPFSSDAQGLIRYNGLDSFTYRVRDSDGSTADATVTLTVGAGVNHPVYAADDSYTVSNMFPSADFTTSAGTGVLVNDTAPDGGLTVLGIVVGGTVQAGFVPTAAGGQANISPDGRLTYDQPFSSDAQGLIRYNGLDSFTYRVRDSDGSTADATVTLTVGAGVNHPVYAADDKYFVRNDFPSADFTTDIATGVLANDYAPDGGLVVLGIVVGGTVQAGFVPTAAGGQANISPDGRLTYDQPFSSDAQGLIRYNGLDSFTYRVRDSDGSTADATVTLTVGAGVNHPVYAADDKYFVRNDFPSADFTTDIATGVLANDYAPDGGLVVLGIVVGGTVQAGFVPTAAGGQANISPDGRLTYDQPFSSDAQGLIRYNGLDSFTYRVRDSDGSTADATVTLTVGAGVNHPVYAADDSYTVSNIFPSADFTTSAGTGVLVNDTAPDGGLTVLGIVVGGTVQAGFVPTAAGGQANISPDGRLTYDQPFSSDAQGIIRYNGLDSFAYRVRDSDGSTADATVTLTVGAGVNHPVYAADDSYTVSNIFPSADFTTDIATGVLANDYAPDGGLVVLGIVVNGAVQTGFVRTAAGGQAEILANGQLVYDQPFSLDGQGSLVRYNGSDSFTYRVRDGDGSIADATVTLTVGSGVQPALTKNADTVVGTSADDLISVGTQTLSLGDRIDGGGGTNHLQLVGGGIFNLSVPTMLANVQVVDAQEGQAASGSVAATNQSITLRSGLDVTVNVRSATVNPANPKAPTITINGANDASIIKLGAGNAIVTVGGAHETVLGGTGNSQIQVTAATIGATIDGGSGNSSLYVLGGGSDVTMGSNITRTTTVFLAQASGPMSFIANSEAGLIVNDLNKGADTVAAGGLNQMLTGGAGSATFVGFAGGATTFKNSAAAFSGDKIGNFFAPGSQIDLIDMKFTALQPLRFDAGILQVSDGAHAASMSLTGPVPAGVFVTHQDSGGGTIIGYQHMSG